MLRLDQEGAVEAGAVVLQRRGHVLTPISTAQYGGYQGIWRDPETKAYVGATEMRKDGCAMGY